MYMVNCAMMLGKEISENITAKGKYIDIIKPRSLAYYARAMNLRHRCPFWIFKRRQVSDK